VPTTNAFTRSCACENSLLPRFKFRSRTPTEPDRNLLPKVDLYTAETSLEQTDRALPFHMQDQKKRSSSSSKKKSAKRRRQNLDLDEDEDKDAAAETETEDESREDAESESEDADLADESGSEDELESHIRSRTRSGSKRAKEKVRKVLQYDVADRVEAGARAEPSGTC
jgi:hypothetical protein